MGLGILCPGQGSQSPQMLDILKGNAKAEAILDLARPSLEGRHPFDLAAGSPETLYDNAIAQPLCCAAALAAWAELEEDLPRPLAFAGYSVGEVAAHGCAGTFSPERTFDLARLRARCMDQAADVPQGLRAIKGIKLAILSELCRRQGAYVAIINAEDRAVVGGTLDSLIRMKKEVLGLGGGITPLPISVASHTPLMSLAVPAFLHALVATRMQAPSAPVMVGLDGSEITDPSRVPKALSNQLGHTIDWRNCLRGLRERGCTILLELGPGNGLAKMATEFSEDWVCRSVADFKSLAGVKTWVGRSLEAA